MKKTLATIATIGALAVGATVATAQTPSGQQSAYTPATPCRLIDTRPDGQGIYRREGQIGPRTTRRYDANAGCGIPQDATAITVNITTVSPSQQTYLTMWDDGTMPLAATINPSPALPVYNNSATVPLASDGGFRIYNHNGAVHYIVDVVGFHSPVAVTSSSTGPIPEPVVVTQLPVEYQQDGIEFGWTGWDWYLGADHPEYGIVRQAYVHNSTQDYVRVDIDVACPDGTTNRQSEGLDPGETDAVDFLCSTATNPSQITLRHIL